MEKRELRQVYMDLAGGRLDVEFKEFSGRLRFQKLLYLLTRSGAVASPHHTFNLYVYGPYSPGWAKEGFAVVGGGHPSVEVSALKLKRVSPFLKGKSLGQLVALATLHYYHTQLGLDKRLAREKAERDGKQTVLSQLDWAWSDLESAHWFA